MSKTKWIQGAIKPSHKGLLHEKLGVPQGQKIPAAKIEKAAKAPGALGKEARFAENVGRLTKHTKNTKMK